MKVFFDTSVLVAVFYADHEHHARSFATFARSIKRRSFCAAHTLAELYATLTAMPPRYRVTGDQAMLFIGNVLERLTVVELTANEYTDALRHWSTGGVVGGAIYDALIATSALKARADVIYSWNARHFTALGSDVAERLRTPDAS